MWRGRDWEREEEGIERPVRSAAASASVAGETRPVVDQWGMERSGVWVEREGLRKRLSVGERGDWHSGEEQVDGRRGMERAVVVMNSSGREW